MLLTQPMMQPEAHCKIIRHCVRMVTIPTVRHLVSINESNLRKLLISMSLQNTVHGQPILKQVYQVAHSKWIHLRLPKDKLLKPVKKVEKINRVKFWLGFGMAVSPLPKQKMVHFFSDQLSLVLLKPKP
ncbi:hypothetical protein HMPREF3050_01235 [Neisseria sp. HMSC065D04]|uniref:Uncharacterized protein n=1 Tax=Neisseria macacae ATCC 33926 TaxID=997348 RepID=A0AA36ULW5_9NEIS|nr:hypothetical protein HMPREF9418_0496 [Neisseria macacae ATCC 33926]OFO37999.1 hypothetical protein HMPREF3050_01235 [Neisseria sp. HMSC065D04]